MKPVSNEDTGRRTVLVRLCLIQFGIPSVLLLFQWLLLFITVRGATPKIDRLASSLIAAALLAAGLGLWWFFGSVMFRRLWQVFPVAGDERKFWVYAEGVFGLTGVGVAMPALLGFFQFLLSSDVVAGSALGGISLALGFYEASRFDAKVETAVAIISETQKKGQERGAGR